MSVGSPQYDLIGDVRPIGSGSDWFAAGKRAVDLACAVVLLIPALPLMLAAMLLVRLTSRGPAIYTQARVGLGGRTFVIYKIRTMSHGCERLTGPVWAHRSDSRVTLVGAILRQTHIDELPQLFNVLKGDMTLVGPRPERPEFVEQLERAIPYYRARLDIRPGVTGLAQLLLPSDVDVSSVRSKLTYDLYYLRRSGRWLDAKIVACTMLKVLGVPRGVNRKLLGVPDHGAIEGAYEAMVSCSPQPVEQPEMQAAF
jgi:lipopolysaccharide/colanic/teichoic acid biosynthesis glycosyltransferase